MGAFKIAIIGAGPAGCTLARLLLKASIEVTVFEGEINPDIRSQGGTLDLHDNTGIAALKEAGLYEEFLKSARFDGESLMVTDKKLLPYLKLGGQTKSSSRGRPEIDRSQLRKLLFDSLPEGVIRWGYRLRSISEDLTLHFDQGNETGFDLVIGADGAWSKVRPLMTSEVPGYSGVNGLSWSIRDAEERYPDLHKLVNRGSLFSWSDAREIVAQQMGDGSLHCATWAARDEEWGKQPPFDVHNTEAVKAAIREEYHDWDPQLLKLAEVGDPGSFVARNLYTLPRGHRWTNLPGVTLIGDAAHVTVPFAGEGVNLAMTDALKLSKAIIEANKAGSKQKLFNNIKEFEEDMFTRADLVMDLSLGNMEDMFFTPGAPRASIERFVIRGMSTQIHPVGVQIIKPLVYAGYWLYKRIY